MAKSEAKKRKEKILGMPLATAERKLRKSIIFSLASQVGLLDCRFCGEKISSLEDLAIVHHRDWSDDKDLFWDLNNVAFSHVSCAAEKGGFQQRKNTMDRVEITIEDQHGNPLEGGWHHGQLYVAAKKGSRYQIRVRNKTHRRIEAVITVDGRSVLSGKSASFSERGYVFSPYETATIKGWRQNHDQVAAFEFSSVGGSYSSKMGSPQNVGVIGVAVFEERVIRQSVAKPFSQQHWLRSRGSDFLGEEVERGFSSLESSVSASTTRSGGQRVNSTRGVTRGRSKSIQKVGTGYGQQLNSSISTTTFTRETQHPCEVLTVRYNSRNELVKLGVIGNRNEPQAFPGEPYIAPGFCKPPR